MKEQEVPDPTLKFRHEIIDPNPPGAHIDITLIADVDGDGKQDIIIGGKQGEANLWWYKNPGWERHIMAVAPGLEAGGVVLDINGDGRADALILKNNLVRAYRVGSTSIIWSKSGSYRSVFALGQPVG